MRKGEGVGYGVFSWMGADCIFFFGLGSFFFSCLHWLLDIPWGFCNTACIISCIGRQAY